MADDKPKPPPYQPLPTPPKDPPKPQPGSDGDKGGACK